MKTRITSIEFSRRFNSARMAFINTPLTFNQLSEILKVAKVYHSSMFISKLVENRIISELNGVYLFSQNPIYFKRFEPILDWEYNRNKKYKETSKRSELENAIAICKKHGLHVLKEV